MAAGKTVVWIPFRPATSRGLEAPPTLHGLVRRRTPVSWRVAVPGHRDIGCDYDHDYDNELCYNTSL